MIELSHKPLIRAYNMDCMAFMADKPDGAYELAIVDPPYGIGEALVKGGEGGGWFKMIHSEADKWDIAPNKEYFDELFRVSVSQIIWGGNYFNLPTCQSPICWDKVRPNQKNASEWEYAWTSFKGRARKFTFCNNGGFVLPSPRIHPCQKPPQLYRWLLTNYAKPGQTILDTHGGSFSSAIACWKEGYDMDICELDQEYFEAACERFERETRQQQLFPTPGEAL